MTQHAATSGSHADHHQYFEWHFKEKVSSRLSRLSRLVKVKRKYRVWVSHESLEHSALTHWPFASQRLITGGDAVELQNVKQLQVIARWSSVKKNTSLCFFYCNICTSSERTIKRHHRLSPSMDSQVGWRVIYWVFRGQWGDLKVMRSPCWHHIFSSAPFDELMSSKTISTPGGLHLCLWSPPPLPPHTHTLLFFLLLLLLLIFFLLLLLQLLPLLPCPSFSPHLTSASFFSSPFCCSPSLPITTFYPSCYCYSSSSSTITWFVLCDVVEDVERWEELLLQLLLLPEREGCGDASSRSRRRRKRGAFKWAYLLLCSLWLNAINSLVVDCVHFHPLFKLIHLFNSACFLLNLSI